MTDTFAGTYYDGTGGAAHAVALRRVGLAHYAVEGEGVHRGGSIASLRITPRLARIARTVEFPDGARLLVAHDAAIDAWFPRQGRLEALVDRMEHHAQVVAVAIVICAASLGAGGFWGVPWLSDRIADAVPVEVEKTLGGEVLENLDELGLKASTLAADRRDALATRFRKLAHDAGGDDYRLEFRDAKSIGPNAFAIPGGTVVVTDQLVKLLGDDREFDAVVAHEIGHQRNRHALRQTLRGSFVAIVAALFTGDVSSAGAVVVAVPTFLLHSHYSRAFEEEADRYAFDLLARENESPHWFAAAMNVLEKTRPERGHRMSYLSSHPSTGDRILAAENAAQVFAAAHPDLCPNGVCPGEEETECEDCNDDDESPPTSSENLSCSKPDDDD
ncbi:MAG TPA: M48 family metallopeptidase [Rhodanobacteraceae bacterium]|nr:M48 family metallopeptidase [Rhodanobacteraceae bacterium]